MKSSRSLLLRRADANWLDENLDAIFVRDLRARNIELFGELEAAKREIEAARKDAEEARIGAQREVARLAAAYEAKPSLRMSKRLHEMLDALPAGIGGPLKRLLSRAKD